VSLPPELYWIQHLLTRRGVSGTLQLLEAWCRDTADGTPDPQLASRWRACANILEDTVALIKRVEPALPIGEEPPEGGLK
jgi:hypothetical protein